MDKQPDDPHLINPIFMNDTQEERRPHQKLNRAYCFINFRHVLFVYDFFKNKEGYHWPKYDSTK
jgi:hypothetical protein